MSVLYDLWMESKVHCSFCGKDHSYHHVCAEQWHSVSPADAPFLHLIARPEPGHHRFDECIAQGHASLDEHGHCSRCLMPPEEAGE